MNRPIQDVESAFQNGRAALMPYVTIGYPDFGTSLDVVRACEQAGADLIELGIPFSDPLADGPTIQHSTQRALESGTTVSRCLAAVSDLRAGGLTSPFMLMGYYNPLLSYGLQRLVNHAAESGANGFIIPDLPPEEASEMQIACRDNGLAISFLLAPNSTDERIELVTTHATGFMYLVSVTGTTGARAALPPGLKRFVQRVRGVTHMPLAVGFGISNAAQARSISEIADGVIVGSALINTVRRAHEEGSDPAQAAEDFIAGLQSELV